MSFTRAGLPDEWSARQIATLAMVQAARARSPGLRDHGGGVGRIHAGDSAAGRAERACRAARHGGHEWGCLNVGIELRAKVLSKHHIIGLD